MASARVPQEVRDFISRYLPSIEHLDIFVLLRSHTSRMWSAGEIALELRMPASIAEGVLDRLAADNFLDIKISNNILFRYNPATVELEHTADRCAEFYARERIAVINLVTSGT